MFSKENNLGGGHRPRHRYRPAPLVARKIIKAVERERTDAILSFVGKSLAVFKGLVPWLNEITMQSIAKYLRD
jgi:hypothetical protein